MSLNRQFRLAAVPKGMPKESDFSIAEATAPTPGAGEVLVRTAFWSVDPYMRGRISGVRTYADPVLVGDLMVGGTVGQIVQSNDEVLQPGDFVAGYWGWQEWAVSKAKGLQKLDPSVAPVSTALGILGMPGMTAYFGFLDLCAPKPGETVVVSGAAGAVGSYVCQIAKIKGCRVIGTAGTDAKIDYLKKDLGLDGAFNYKTTTDYSARLKELCPNGIDCYFDNTGGPVSDAVFPLLNTFARVSVCGQISHYNAPGPELGPRLLGHILVKHRENSPAECLGSKYARKGRFRCADGRPLVRTVPGGVMSRNLRGNRRLRVRRSRGRGIPSVERGQTNALGARQL